MAITELEILEAEVYFDLFLKKYIDFLDVFYHRLHQLVQKKINIDNLIEQTHELRSDFLSHDLSEKNIRSAFQRLYRNLDNLLIDTKIHLSLFLKEKDFLSNAP